jgi:hypothetical protein
MKHWIRRLSPYSTLAGVALFPWAQTTADEGDVALIVFLVAVGLTLLLALGLAALMWVISWRSPHANVGAEPKGAAKKGETLPPGVHLPPPSIQPLILALGVTIVGFGAVFRGFAIQLSEEFSIPLILVLGLIITLAGFVGWVREGRHPEKSH